ncbi:MAG: FprA family A-type flavoprotein [Spirochaetales bacterium]|nr:FprA family A-type flavoprotein [Spirochaetales bacterium]MBR6060686.1 FprA family A-type flavoprotein [Spirochaetales bacterium]MBR6200205.1 FprA family A-type flavoprotein [Spirochaetales bacterium]
MSDLVITNAIKYVGVNDHKIDLFEGHYNVPNGMAYNSYIILDKKIVVVDSVDQHFGKEWLENIERVLGDLTPSGLIVQHMEPDHSANIGLFMEKYPNAKIVSSAKAFTMMKNYFGTDYPDRQIVVNEDCVLDLGKHVLKFVAAPMVHWPEVIMTYDTTENILFSADAFGKFGALDVDEPWADEARRYYIGIVGKYGPQVQAVLKKAAALDIKTICPLHGPVLTDTIPQCLDLYQKWSSYTPESDGILVAYTSVYGHTKAAVELLVDTLKAKGCKVVLHDLARTDMSLAVADAFRFGKIVLATTTYNMDIFPYMKEFINGLTERNFQNKTIGLMENGSWAPAAVKKMLSMLETSKNLTFVEPTVTITSALNDTSKAQIAALADAINR